MMSLQVNILFIAELIFCSCRRYDSITDMLLEMKLFSHSRVLRNAKLSFTCRWIALHAQTLVKHTCNLVISSPIML